MVRYTDILDGIADKLESLDTSGYQWAATDEWKRARTVNAERMGTRHLEFWIELNQADIEGAGGLFHSTGELVVTCRYVLDDAYTSQGRILDAALHAMQALQEWNLPAAEARTLPRGHRIDNSNSELVALVIPFTLRICKWRA